MRRIPRKIIILSMVMMLTILVSCGEEESGSGSFTSGECIVSAFDDSAAEVLDGFSIDYSGASKGYIGVKAGENYSELVFRVTFGGTTYTYWFDNNNRMLIVPLQQGSGSYGFKLLKNVTGDKYVAVYNVTKEISVEDEFQPFIRSNSLVNYTSDSNCVKSAQKLAGQSDNDSDFVSRVYSYIEDELEYDYEFAGSDPDMYYPNLDETLKTGKGICFDYAALAAGMLRSQGIPAKLITGYVSLEGEVYHAWNMVYLKNKGWITVKISVSTENWNQVDITLDDTGDASAISGSSYTNRYVY